MFDDQDGCDWANVSSGTGSPGLSRTKVKQLCVCVVATDCIATATQTSDHCISQVASLCTSI